MKTITVTEAKRQLGHFLKRAAAGEDIGIICGGDIISLRKIVVVAADRVVSSRVRETPATRVKRWPKFPVFDAGPVDGAANHDDYLYGKNPSP